MNRVTVVVLNWNGADLIANCLESLVGQDYSNCSVIVIDNNSTDNSREVLEDLKAQYPDKLQVVHHPTNSGFAGGVNIGIRAAIEQGSNAVALLNNDAVARPNWLSELVQVLDQRPDIGIATGLLLHGDGKTIDSSGDFYSVWGLAFPRSRDETSEAGPESGYVFGATGGASLYRAAIFEQIGFFDEDFFAYYEDVDISFRAQLAGWKVYYTKSAVALHERGATSKKIPGFTKYQMFKNLPQIYWKNVPFELLWKVGWRFKLVYGLMFANAVVGGAFLPAVRGVFSGLALFPSALVKRATIQRSKKVTTKYIESIMYQDLPPTQKGKLRQLVGRSTATASSASENKPTDSAKRT